MGSFCASRLRLFYLTYGIEQGSHTREIIFSENFKVYFIFTFSKRPVKYCFESYAAPSPFAFETPGIKHKVGHAVCVHLDSWA